MKYLIANTRAEARELKRIIKKLSDLPTKGTHIGGGRHVTIDPVPPALGVEKIGWTTEVIEVRKHPTEAKWAAPITVEARAMWAANKARLTAGEKSTVLSSIAAEAELDASWDEIPAP